jgi:hypothetical protein
MKITATINSKIALAAGKNAAGRQEMDLDIAALSEVERKILGEVTKDTPAGGLEITGYQHVCHNMPSVDMDSLRAYLARIADDKASVVAEQAKKYQELRNRICGGELPWEIDSSSNYISYDQRQEIKRMPAYKALIVAADKAAADKAAADKAAADKAAADKVAAEQADRDDMIAWIAANGSPRLRRCISENIECRAAYRDECRAAERPGWRWYDSVRGEFAAPRNPPADAFAQLDAARKMAPDAKLGWHTADEEIDDETGDVTADQWQGYIAHAEFLGRTIVLGGPTK